MAKPSNSAAKAKLNKGAMAMAARTGAKAKAQAATVSASIKRTLRWNLNFPLRFRQAKHWRLALFNRNKLTHRK